MTETGRILVDRHEPRQVTTRAFGRPHGGLEARVVDDKDHEVPRGAEGELLVRWSGPEGPRHGFFAGYLKNAEATEEAWRGGWFHTGDVVRQMPDDMLVFVDRKKNIVRRAGENIAAAEVEACLQAHPRRGPDRRARGARRGARGGSDGLRRADARASRRIARWPSDFKNGVWSAWPTSRRRAGCSSSKSLPTTGTQKVQKTQIFPKGEDPRRRDGALDLREGKKRR